MRFIAAIGVFVLAAIFLGTGLTQKVFFSGPDFASLTTTVGGNASYIVISGDVLASNPGLQTVGASGTDVAFIGYGKSSDVTAWLSGSDYSTITYNTKTEELGSELVVSPKDSAAKGVTTTPVANPIVNPAGSDLWLGERLGSNAVSLPMNIDRTMSVIIAADGVSAAPSIVRLSWPIPGRAPYSTAFIIGGGILLLIGLVLYIWALLRMKREQGPRRRGRIGKMPKPPKPRKMGRSPAPKILSPAKGRRALERRSAFLIVPLGLTLALGLAACASPYEKGTGVVSPSATPTRDAGLSGQLPDVTSAQLTRIMARVSETLSTADKKLDGTLAATRLVGPALQIRSANYAMRLADANVAALAAIPASPVTFVMPQATDAWPRYVMTVIQDPNDTTVPTTGLVLIQQSPRENYHVEYSVTLEPNATVPEVAPSTVGSAIVAPDSKLLLIQPNQLALAYGDILLKGDASPYAGLFDGANDTLRTQIGLPYKDAKRTAIGEKATIEYTQQLGTAPPVSLATNNSGAIVTVNLNEIETVRPTEARAVVNAEGQTKVLAGIASSVTGIESTYGVQLAFYVPPLGSTEKIRLLGFSQGLIAAKGL